MPMVPTMPFSKYDLSVDPELVEAMRAAFYRVCDILQISGDRDDPLTEVVVTKIVELAKAGEREPDILCIDVLALPRNAIDVRRARIGLRRDG
jgi:hypothetical protein